MKNLKVKGFTLAETLITLTILGGAATSLPKEDTSVTGIQ